MPITTLQALRSLYAQPGERARLKQLDRLDPHARRFIGLSPFVVLATHGADGLPDASPRGGAPGFVRVVDEHTLHLPDASGNNRLDTLENIVATGSLGLLFMVPGVDETLRVNGQARLLDDADLCAGWATERRTPKLVIELRIAQAYLHCAKAFMRAQLWDPARHLARTQLPSIGEMIRDQVGSAGPAETQAEMLARYQADL